MPRLKTRKQPPDGWDIVEPILDDLDAQMREVTAESHEGKRRVESSWPIFKIHHQKSRAIFEMYYKKQEISKELYNFCIEQKLIDGNLIAKWKKSGYENLCCLRCIQSRDTNFGTNCICRVPKNQLEEDRVIECVHCGCHGCSG